MLEELNFGQFIVVGSGWQLVPHVTLQRQHGLGACSMGNAQPRDKPWRDLSPSWRSRGQASRAASGPAENGASDHELRGPLGLGWSGFSTRVKADPFGLSSTSLGRRMGPSAGVQELFAMGQGGWHQGPPGRAAKRIATRFPWPVDSAKPLTRLPVAGSRGGAVWQLVGLITRRS